MAEITEQVLIAAELTSHLDNRRSHQYMIARFTVIFPRSTSRPSSWACSTCLSWRDARLLRLDRSRLPRTACASQRSV